MATLVKRKVQCKKCGFADVVVGKDIKEVNAILDAKYGHPSRTCQVCRAKDKAGFLVISM